MDVVTDSPRLHALRRGLLELLLAERPAGALSPDPAGSEFERLLHAHGLEPTGAAAPPPAIDASHPFLRFDASRCIVCRRCVHACDEVQGQFVYSVAGRGSGARLVFGQDERFAGSGCVACGACVDRCPTGALDDVDRIGARHERECACARPAATAAWAARSRSASRAARCWRSMARATPP